MCSDLDATLRDDNGDISKENQDAIRYFQENGGLFTITTGRLPRFMEQFYHQVRPNTLLVAVNGTMLFDIDKQQIVQLFPMDDSVFAVIDFIHKRYPFIPEARFHNVAAQSSDQPWAVGIPYPRSSKIPLQTFFDGLEKPLLKVVYDMPPENLLAVEAEVKENFGQDFRIDRSWNGGLEIHAKNSGKDVCVTALREHIPQKVHTTVCVGDYENDLMMIQNADISYAVQNAIPEVKAAATHITVSNNESALSAVITDLERQIK